MEAEQRENLTRGKLTKGNLIRGKLTNGKINKRKINKGNKCIQRTRERHTNTPSWLLMTSEYYEHN